MSRLHLLLPLALAAAPGLAAQGVVIAPHAVYIDARARSASVLLYNPNPQPAEITISTFFGYPVTDSLGRIVLDSVKAVDATMPSAAGWIQAFPRRLTVAPLERQTVRLLATPPAGLPDGEYWTRLVIAAKGGQVPISGVSDTAAVRVGLTLEVRTIIGVAYRKGPVRTGVAISRLRGRVVGDSVEVWSWLERQGNAAYVGTIHGTLVDSNKKIRAEFRAPISVYYSLEPRYTAALGAGALPPGSYWLKLELKAEREDLAPEVMLRSPAVRDSVEVRVP
jgi:hypothetical protein